jgi:hypothetical protein
MLPIDIIISDAFVENPTPVITLNVPPILDPVVTEILETSNFISNAYGELNLTPFDDCTNTV